MSLTSFVVTNNPNQHWVHRSHSGMFILWPKPRRIMWRCPQSQNIPVLGALEPGPWRLIVLSTYPSHSSHQMCWESCTQPVNSQGFCACTSLGSFSELHFHLSVAYLSAVLLHDHAWNASSTLAVLSRPLLQGQKGLILSSSPNLLNLNVRNGPPDRGLEICDK